MNKKFIVFLSIFIVSSILNVTLVRHFELRNMWGDEYKYINGAFSKEMMDRNLLTLLPGTLEFRHQPILNFHYLGLIADSKEFQKCIVKRDYKKSTKCKNLYYNFLKKAVVYNALLFSLFVTLSAFLAFIIFKNLSIAILTAIGLNFSLRLLFYMGSIYSEVLCLTLLIASFIGLYYSVDRRSYKASVTTGIIFGYTALVRGIVEPYLWGIFCISLIFYFIGFFRKYVEFEKIAIAFKNIILIIVVFTVFTGIQKYVNNKNHGVYGLSSNKWRAIEQGVIYHEHRSDYNEKIYKVVSDEHSVREIESKKRVLKYLKEVDLKTFFNSHLKMIVEKYLRGSYFEIVFVPPEKRGYKIAKLRWSNLKFSDGIALVRINYIQNILVFILAFIAALLFIKTKAILIILFIGYYFLAFFLVGYSGRFVIPILPFAYILSSKLIYELYVKIKKEIKKPA